MDKVVFELGKSGRWNLFMSEETGAGS